jgi:hypothetical protein
MGRRRVLTIVNYKTETRGGERVFIQPSLFLSLKNQQQLGGGVVVVEVLLLPLLFRQLPLKPKSPCAFALVVQR